METVKSWQKFKEAADIFLRENKSVYIKDSSDNIYFGELVLVGEETILIQCFGPPHRSGQKIKLYWPLIIKFDEYKEIRSAKGLEAEE